MQKKKRVQTDSQTVSEVKEVEYDGGVHAWSRVSNYFLHDARVRKRVRGLVRRPFHIGCRDQIPLTTSLFSFLSLLLLIEFLDPASGSNHHGTHFFYPPIF